jgi:hypothetical protein
MEFKAVAVSVIAVAMVISLRNDRNENHLETRTYQEVPTLSGEVWTSTLSSGHASVAYRLTNFRS